MQRVIVSIFLILTFLCSPAISETAADWFMKADELWDGKKFSDPKKAIEYLNNAIKLQPNYTNAYISRGLAYDELGDYQRALEDYNQVLLPTTNLDSLTKSYDKRGVTYANLGKYNLAIDDFNKAISLKPDYADAYNNRGIVYFLQDDKKQGCLDAKKACELGVCKLLEMAKGKGYCR